jgi:ribonuclease P protein component
MSFNKKDKNKTKKTTILKRGKIVKIHEFTFYFETNKNRRTIIIPKSIIKNAVDRNKMRRRVKEIIREIDYENKCDVKIKVNENIIKKTYKELKELINNIYLNTL